jgi:O-antigen/teichoic acid export membrane protein
MVLDAGIVFSRRIYLIATMAAVALAVNAASNLGLVPRLGFMGASCSLLISMSVFSIGIGLISNRLFPIRVDWWRLALGSTIFGVAIVAGAQIGVQVTVGAIALKLAVVSVVGAGFYRGVLNVDEQRSMLVAVNRLVSRIRRSVV